MQDGLGNYSINQSEKTYYRAKIGVRALSVSKIDGLN
jgi:hypothetical protein